MYRVPPCTYHFAILQSFPYPECIITAPAPYTPTEFEKVTYYYGIPPDPPELLYRSNWADTPFYRPTGGRFQHIPAKTAHGIFNTPLNPVWRTVAPQIRDELKRRKIRYSAIHTARFASEDGKGLITVTENRKKDTLGPVVIWIAVHPGSTTAEDAHLASPAILALLEAHGVRGTVVEWYEGAVRRL
ncbi:hypothetical protein BD626DRAFT_408860 [Schizophyllum amplum]|uniref:Uncharacterized protein n=1 Tax=Schizophyllum amplum TaxID=97359 RepID=A0A550C4B6_9AGAR|nr:hypothetical protein BD626DRAFT_408860 [Auriculariopsis ampla]